MASAAWDATATSETCEFLSLILTTYVCSDVRTGKLLHVGVSKVTTMFVSEGRPECVSRVSPGFCPERVCHRLGARRPRGRRLAGRGPAVRGAALGGPDAQDDAGRGGPRPARGQGRGQFLALKNSRGTELFWCVPRQ